MAIGSVCEPLDFPDYTKEFLEEILKLRNPVQISTKVNYKMKKILKKVDALISMCVAIDDIAKKFEPKRLPPSSRLEFCEEINGGVFLRPILQR